MNTTALLDAKSRILDRLARRGPFETRMAERGDDGIVEYFQHGQWIIPDLTEKEVIGLLHDLEAAGMIESEENVHPHDSAEYLVTWRLRASG